LRIWFHFCGHPITWINHSINIIVGKYILKVGDLVKLKEDNDATGLIIAAEGNFFRIQWLDGFCFTRYDDELELISASR
tara:strand:+ start:72 stop:308 length:237 start_codon:yes stop_codon:yes gene_type:complete